MIILKIKKFSPINEHGYYNNGMHERVVNHYPTTEKEVESSRRSPDSLVSPTLLVNNRKTLPNNPVCLLTPSVSYASLITLNGLNGGTVSANIKSNNIVIDSSVLFLNYYKRFAKLLFDSMDNGKILEVVRSRNLCTDIQFCTHHQHTNQSSHHSRNVKSLQSGQKIYAIESLDMYLERLVSSPRSLKSLCRRMILNRLSETQKISNDLNNEVGLVQVTSQIEQLSVPKRVKNYLLFIE